MVKDFVFSLLSFSVSFLFCVTNCPREGRVWEGRVGELSLRVDSVPRDFGRFFRAEEEFTLVFLALSFGFFLDLWFPPTHAGPSCVAAVWLYGTQSF